MVDNNTQLALSEINNSLGQIASVLGDFAALSAEKNKPAEKNVKAADMLKQIFPKGSKIINAFDKVGGEKGALGMLASSVTTTTVALGAFAGFLATASKATMDYRNAVNASSLALNKSVKGSLETQRLAGKVKENISKLYNDSLLSDAVGGLAFAFNYMAEGILNQRRSENPNKYDNNTYSTYSTEADVMYKQMVSGEGYSEAVVNAALNEINSGLVSAGIDYEKSKALAAKIAHTGFTYSSINESGAPGFKTSASQIAAGISSGSMYDAATGVRLDDDILAGWAMANKRVLPQYASESVLAQERYDYLMEAYTKSVHDGTKAAADFAKGLKKTGEVMNDVQNTLFSFDEVIQFAAKVYEDVDGNVVQSIDKKMTAGVTGDTSPNEAAQIIDDIQPGVRIGDNSIYGDNSGNSTINNYNYGNASSPIGSGSPIINSGSLGRDIYEELLDDGNAGVGAINKALGLSQYSSSLDIKAKTRANTLAPVPDLSSFSNVLNLNKNSSTNSFGKSKFSNPSDLPTYLNPLQIKTIFNGARKKMGRGGIALSDVNATVGEAGKEAVIPLEHYNGVEYLANAMNEAAQSSGGSLGGDTVNVTLSGTILEMNDYNVRRLGQKLAAVIENNKRRNGGV